MTTQDPSDSSMPRRRFLKLASTSVGAVSGIGAAAGSDLKTTSTAQKRRRLRPTAKRVARPYDAEDFGEFLNQIAFPLGGIGAGMICLEGSGAPSPVSLRNRPEGYKQPCVFGAIAVRGKQNLARVIEGPVPARKIFGPPDTGNGAGGTTYGLPRFASASFKTRFPFGVVKLTDSQLPVQVELSGWSP